MKIFNVHQENWEDVKNLLGLDCKAPHLEVGIDYFAISNAYIRSISKFLGKPPPTTSISSFNPLLEQSIEEREAFTHKSFSLYEGPIFIGGVGLTKGLLKNKEKAHLADKFEQIHCALGYLSPFYTMRLDPLAHRTGKILYKAFEEDISWAFLKQMEGTDEIINFRQKILDENVPIKDDARKAMIITEETLRKTDPLREPVRAFKEYMKIFAKEDLLKRHDINVEDDYKGFVSMGYKYIRFLDDEIEYFQPKFI